MADPFVRAQDVIAQLVAAETESGIAPDKRRVLSAERHGLQAALQVESAPKTATAETYSPRLGMTTGYREVNVPADTGRLIALTNEAIRTAALWGVEIK